MDMTIKEQYLKFCEVEKDIPIFFQPWWLDIVCERNGWNVLLYKENKEILAVLPYKIEKKIGFSIIKMPILTPRLGIYMKNILEKNIYKKISFEKKVYTNLINQLENFSYFNQNFIPSFNNWLPFYWKGFNQTTKYTYVLSNNNIENIFMEIQGNITRRIKKLIKNEVSIIESDDIETFYKLNQLTFKNKGKKVPYSLDFIKKLYNECIKREQIKLIFVKNNSNDIMAGGIFISDNKNIYYLMGTTDNKYQNISPMNLVLFEGIKIAISQKKNFDFEGSMIEGIEKYFRSFGAKQIQYFNISKINSKILGVLLWLKRKKS